MSALRFVLVGAGGMGRAWIAALAQNPDAELVGVVDLDVPLAERTVAEFGLDALAGADAVAVARAADADAVLNVTVPGAHHPVNTAALFAGYPVLCEKPIAPTVAQALSLAAASEASGSLLMTSQSRRYEPTLTAFREQVRGLGRLGFATTEFFKAPHFGGFREEMAHVLLVDMAIHAFDTARYLLEREPVAVYCEEFNPAWSWYAADAAASAVFEFEGGLRYGYTGSWCADGAETSWNGSWRVNGERGTALWNGDEAPTVQHRDSERMSGAVAPEPAGIDGSLAEFVDAVRTARTPSGEVHRNVRSLAMVEAAVVSAAEGRRVTIAEVLEVGYATALAEERREDVRAVLAGWGSVAGLDRIEVGA
ncbi:Gfo/Idh/MocA family oxidoreductase [Microbacteriaceae bacterium VKM Ac-2854]|nr:Gfo/Idh/MocA family oxidoreductase [Microbacteriaceae bacterium VKM Ac-2854]